VLIQLASASLPLPSPSQNDENEADLKCNDDGGSDEATGGHESNEFADTSPNDMESKAPSQPSKVVHMPSSPPTIPQSDPQQHNRSEQVNLNHHTRHHHHCRKFIGIEISPERALEAQTNIQNARQSKLVPEHVSIEIRCMNALEVNYAHDATVCFLYLVPRGLRLMKPLLWGLDRVKGGDIGVVNGKEGMHVEDLDSTAVVNDCGGGDDWLDAEKGIQNEWVMYGKCQGSKHMNVDENDVGGSENKVAKVVASGDHDEGTILSSVVTPISSDMKNNEQDKEMQEDRTTSNQTIPQTNNQDNNCTDESNNIGRTKKKPRRIITYMAGFEDEKYLRKEHCQVDHQEGAAWPVYLYHVNVE